MPIITLPKLAEKLVVNDPNICALLAEEAPPNWRPEKEQIQRIHGSEPHPTRG